MGLLTAYKSALSAPVFKPRQAAKILRRWSALASCAFLLGSCAAGGGTPQLSTSSLENQTTQTGENRSLRSRNKVKVALLLPLTAKGKTAKIAKGLKQAGELALFEFDNPNVVLITKDTKGTPAGAMEAAEAAISSGAELVIGPLFATSVKAAAPLTRAANIPMVALSSDESVAGDGVFLLSFLAGRDLNRIISFAISQGKRNFAALVPQTPYGTIVETAFRDAVSKNGGQILAIEKYPLDANGMLEPTRKISEIANDPERQLDALLIPAGPEVMPTMSPLMPYFEIDTKKLKLIGTSRWDYANVGREKPLLGGWFPGPDPTGWRDFTQRYVQTYGNVPPRISSLAYDAVSMALAISKNPKENRYTAAQITRASGFSGVDGLFRFHQDGTSERGFAVLEVQKFGNRVIDAAPNVFQQRSFNSSSLMQFPQ